ncbi:hypothetical protein CDAR_430061 [Caerostris darwini]|uniref:Uncharacterized protein n=1 Tax=Caerostris darwini TaxID=1538125 RepID=A0AAV4WFD9_9ARAC|nr:hypothetical protein CDAR_430061 [Caerostris darwini]
MTKTKQRSYALLEPSASKECHLDLGMSLQHSRGFWTTQNGIEADSGKIATIHSNHPPFPERLVAKRHFRHSLTMSENYAGVDHKTKQNLPESSKRRICFKSDIRLKTNLPIYFPLRSVL